jgi:hypothetical protein
MPGSKSSAPELARDAAVPLSFTVHEVAPPDLADTQRRTLSGRIKMLLVLLVCASPVVASYFTYFVIRPEGRTNYGTLITPSRSLPAAELRTLAGEPVPGTSLKGQWLLVVVGPSSCDAACEQRLLKQRQLREMLGRESARLDKVWLITDSDDPKPALRTAIEAGVPVKALRADRTVLSAWLAPEPGQALEDHLYLVDPMGEWMMRFPAGADPVRVKRDLNRLMRASAFWDEPGR